MPRQFFIAPLICVTDQSGINCAPKVNKQQVNYTAACQDWQAPNPQCLVLAAGNTTSAEGDTDLVSLVADNFDTVISTLPNNVRNRVNNGLTQKGVPLNVNDYTLVRDFLGALGRFFDPNFTLEHFWIAGS